MKTEILSVIRIKDDSDEYDIPIEIEFAKGNDVTKEGDILWIKEGIYGKDRVAMTRNQAVYMAKLILETWNKEDVVGKCYGCEKERPLKQYYGKSLCQDCISQASINKEIPDVHI